MLIRKHILFIIVFLGLILPSCTSLVNDTAIPMPQIFIDTWEPLSDSASRLIINKDNTMKESDYTGNKIAFNIQYKVFKVENGKAYAILLEKPTDYVLKAFPNRLPTSIAYASYELTTDYFLKHKKYLQVNKYHCYNKYSSIDEEWNQSINNINQYFNKYSKKLDSQQSYVRKED